MEITVTSVEELPDAILRRADQRLAELCQHLCRQVTLELDAATTSLLRKVEVQDPTEPNSQLGLSPKSSLGNSLRAAGTGHTMAWASHASPSPVPNSPNYEPRLMTQPLPLSTSRALQELEDQGAEIPKQGAVKPRVVDGRSEEDEEGVMKLQRGITKSSKKGGITGAAERIFGLVPQTSSDEQPQVGLSWYRSRVQRIIRNNWFECFVMSMVLLHSLLTGIQIHAMSVSQAASLYPGTVHTVMNLIFCLFFGVEVSLRLYVYRLRFFTMYGCAWNVLDLLIALFHFFEEVGAIVAQVTATNEPELANSSILRTIRILRGIKVIRLVRFIRYAEELQLIVSCLILSFRTFLWSIGLLVMTFYVMAIYTTQAAHLHRVEFPDSSVNDALEKWWGGIFTSMLSVLQALSGGVDWNDIVQPLITISPTFACIFILYIGFCFFALMNVITGTYVETVSRQAADLKTRTQILQARRVFQAIDEDHSGFISLEEIQSQTASSVVLEFFESVDVDPSEAQYLLEVLDMDGSGTINFEEFLHGTLRDRKSVV